MNKFELLLSLLNKIQDEYLGTKIDDMGGYGDRAYIDIKMEDGSTVKVEVCVTKPKEEESNDD